MGFRAEYQGESKDLNNSKNDGTKCDHFGEAKGNWKGWWALVAVH